MPADAKSLGVWAGIGLVIANMIGAGVFLSTGFMAQDLGPGTILLAWLAGGVVALSGTKAYAAVIKAVPRSGGEYRLLSELIHPMVGYAAGWASLLVGFSAPVALDALAAGSFAQTLWPSVDARWLGAGLIAALAFLHALGLGFSHWTQNLLVLVKVTLVLAFTAVGLIAGMHAWPAWQPANPGQSFTSPAFVQGLFFIAFAFSGWNAAVYVADEFREPRKTVPRAMLSACGAVVVLYLLMNWVFVANLTPQQASAVFVYESKRVTLGHLIMKELIGDVGAKAMSMMAIALFVSAMSAMIFAGPRIYAAMASDGFLPRVFATKKNFAPAASTLLQGALSIILIFTHPVQQVLQNIGAVLTLFTALTALTVFRLRRERAGTIRASRLDLLAAFVYVTSAAWMLYVGLRHSPSLVGWIAVLLCISAAAYAVSPRRPAARSREQGSAVDRK